MRDLRDARRGLDRAGADWIERSQAGSLGPGVQFLDLPSGLLSMNYGASLRLSSWSISGPLIWLSSAVFRRRDVGAGSSSCRKSPARQSGPCG